MEYKTGEALVLKLVKTERAANRFKSQEKNLKHGSRLILVSLLSLRSLPLWSPIF